MNNFLLDLFPVLLFFIVFKYKGIYAATWAGIITTMLQVLIHRYRHKNWDKMQLVTLVIFLVFGGMTLYFHNPIFVKWKPTLIFWVFSMVLLGSQFIGEKPLMQRLLEGTMKGQKNAVLQLELPVQVGKKLNLAWSLFFLALGGINLYVAYNFGDEAWVNFKLYGITLATIAFSILQTIFLMRYLKS